MTNSSKIAVKDLKHSLSSTSKTRKFFRYQINDMHFSSRVAGHPLAQNERSLHIFLQEDKLDFDKYVPGRVRNT